MFIGKRIEALRKAKKMKLIEVAEATGIQLATLSRIENMKMTGTLESHIKIAKALGVDVTEIYRDIEKENAVIEFQHQRNSADVFTHSDTAFSEILTKNILDKKMMPVLIRIEPGGKTNTEESRPGSEKFIFLLEGNIEIKVNDKKYPLTKHSTMYFDAALPHSLHNIGKNNAKVLCVSTPVSL
jgi:transcriptional regulator with XRE-family HTH domain